jgi:hypothetical protein
MSVYREFDDFANSSTSNSSRTSNPLLLKYLQETRENVRNFTTNVETIERKVDQLNTRDDTPAFREELLQLVTDTVQLAKITNGPIQKLRLQGHLLSPTERNQFESLMTSFSSYGIKFKNLQRLTQNLEKQRLNQDRQVC